MFSASTVSPRTLCQTEVPTLPLRSGRCFFRLWVPWPVFPLVTIPRSMARQSGKSRTWNPPNPVWLLASHPPGPPICPGNTLTTLWSAKPQVLYVTLHGDEFWPPLFLCQESYIAVPSLQAHLCHTCRLKGSCSSGENSCTQPTSGFPALEYKMGQTVLLSSQDLPLQTDFRKLAPRYIGPHPFERILNPCVGRLTLPAAQACGGVFSQPPGS